MKKQILKSLREYYKLVENTLDITQEIELTNQIAHLEREIYLERVNEYVQQLKDFREHMLAFLDVFSEAEGEEYERFTNAVFTISFMGKSVSIDNGAEVFGAIDDLLECEIDENEEV